MVITNACGLYAAVCLRQQTITPTVIYKHIGQSQTTEQYYCMMQHTDGETQYGSCEEQYQQSLNAAASEHQTYCPIYCTQKNFLMHLL